MEDLLVLLENVFSEEGDADDNKRQGYEHALEQLLDFIEQEGEQAELSEARQYSLSLASRARLLAVVAGHIGTHYWTNNSSRTLANG